MDGSWSTIAQRIVDGLGVAPGELILVRDHTVHPSALIETLLAIEQRGGTPLTEILTADYLARLLRTGSLDHLSAWDKHRLAWASQADRVVVLEGAHLSPEGAPEAAVAAWSAAVGRLVAAGESPPRPYLLVAVPTEARALDLGLSPRELEELLLPALAADTAELRQEIARVRAAVAGGKVLTIRSGDECSLTLVLDDRMWMEDDGIIDDADRARGAVASNLPAGSIYTTVIEDQTAGTLRLPLGAEPAGVTLRFEQGRIVEVSGGTEAVAIRAMLDRHSGDAGRVSHVGIGLNPYLRRVIGWTLVDEHIHGGLFVALGENRYMGGQNVSSLNVDYALPAATLLVDDRVVVQDGALNANAV